MKQQLLTLYNRLVLFARRNKKALLIAVYVVAAFFLISIASRLLLTTQLSSLDNALSDAESSLLGASSSDITTTPEIASSVSISYPLWLANVGYPLSATYRSQLESIYKQTNEINSSLEAISELSEIEAILESIPAKEAVQTTPRTFINRYTEAIETLTQYNAILDLNVVINGLTIIRDSAEIYTTNNRYDIFEARFDNISSEISKELEKALNQFRIDTIEDITALQTSLERF